MKIKYLILVFISALILTGIRPDYLLSQVIEVPGDYATIQVAIDAAVNGDTVLVAEGTYIENLQITSKSITLGSHFLIDGDTSHISKTIIDGSQPQNTSQASVIWVRWSEAATVISGLTITGGYGTEPVDSIRVGGGINVTRSSITISDCRIIDNVISKARVPDTYSDVSGGGIIISPMESQDLSIIIRNNLIADNYVESEMTGGGGIAIVNFYVNNSNYIIENNIIHNNIVQNTDEWKAMGGGIAMNFVMPTGGTQVIRNNRISGNKALCQSSFGGAMYIVLEERTSGGVVDNDPGPFIYNNIFEGNHSDHLGGAIAVWRVYWPEGDVRAWPLTSAGYYTPKPSFINNTFANNSASDGSAFYIMNVKPFLMNNILWNDYPTNAPWGEIFLGNEPTWTSWVETNKYGGVEIYNSVVQGDRWADIDQGVWNIDPAFTDTLYHLSDTSPGTGTGRSLLELKGISYNAPDDDMDGNARPHSSDTFVDLGAYESSYMAQALPLSMTIRSDGFYINPYQVSPSVTTEVVNPHGENLKIYTHLQIPDSADVLTTTELYDDGAHNDQQAGDNIYGGAFEPFNTETMLNLFLSIENLSRGTTMVFSDSNQFTSVGPVVLESVRNVSADTVVNSGDILKFKFTVRNSSSSVTAVNVSSQVVTLDTCALITAPTICSYGDLAPGASLEGGSAQYIRFNKNCAGQTAYFALKIYNNSYNFWTDTFAIDIKYQSPDQVVLLTPPHLTDVNTDSVVFTWKQSKPVISLYWLEYGSDSLFTNSIIDTSGMDTSRCVSQLTVNSGYWWRVKAKNITGWGPFSAAWKFTLYLNAITKTDDLDIEFRLSQNYPNPFNPKTVIGYTIGTNHDSPVQVDLSIYNLIGQKVATLVTEKQPAGIYQVEWDAADFASGIYFYRLSIGSGFIQTRKMLVVR